MYGFTYENQGSKRMLVYWLKEDEKVDEMALGMVNQNKIPGIRQISYTQIDMERYFRYSGRLSETLKNAMGNTVNRNWVLSVLENTCEIIRKSEDYLLEAYAFVLDKDYLFVDRASGDVELVYLPVNGVEESADFSGFFKEIITSCITNPDEDGSYVTTLLNYLNRTENFSLLDFMRLVKELKLSEKEASESRRMERQVERKLDAKMGQNPDAPRPRPMPPADAMRNQASLQAEAKRPAAPEKKPQRREAPIQGEPKKQPQPVQKAYDFEMPGDDLSFEVPGGVPFAPQEGRKKKAAKEKEKTPATGAPEEEKMSFLSLLRNFSGENLEKYRSQKSAKEGADKKADKEEKKADKKAEKKEEKKARGKKKNAKGKSKGVLTLVSMNPSYPKTITVTKENFTIGRRKTNDAILSGMPEVSREHCMIVKEADEYFVIDQRSSFGTVVDGVHCAPGKKSAPLAEGSIIDLPGIQFRVEFQ